MKVLYFEFTINPTSSNTKLAVTVSAKILRPCPHLRLPKIEVLTPQQPPRDKLRARLWLLEYWLRHSTSFISSAVDAFLTHVIFPRVTPL